VSSLLIWVTLAGHSFAWVSWQTDVLVTGGFALIAAAVVVMRRVREPLIPLRLFRNRTVVLAVIASVAVGIALFGTTVFLTQYMQVARGKSPTESGLLTIPMVVGLFGASTVIGRIVSRTGYYKRWMLLGSLSLTAGLALMGTLDEHTSLVELGAFMVFVGAGVGMLMQNLVLVVQNSVPQSDIGAGSSLIAFFRSLGGAVGVSVLGAILASRVASSGADVAHSYGSGIAEIFMVAAPLGLVAFVALLLMRETPLGQKSGIEIAREQRPPQPPRPATVEA
jgi:MFS family permease